MMAFTLSKINLLILAIALFAIISHFAFSFKSVVVADLSRNIADNTMSDVDLLMGSASLCRSHGAVFQRKYSLYGLMDFFYVLELRKIERENFTHLVMSVVERSDYLRERDEAPIVGSARLDLNAHVFIFSESEEGYLCPVDRAILDIRDEVPKDKLMVVKEVFHGEDYLYLIPCSAEIPELCERNVQLAGCYMYRKVRAHQRSGCFEFDVQDCRNMPAPSCWGVSS